MPTNDAVRGNTWTTNNFDLIRLLAASQVAIEHASDYLGLRHPVFTMINRFPGVPIFFFVSGYLIYRSYANITADRLRRFFTNRALRLYPALYVCFALTVLSIYGSGYLNDHPAVISQLIVWAISTLTVFPHYNPDFLRGYGIGAVNGSLWTIGVELQFYALTPLLYHGLQWRRKVILAIGVALVLANLGNAFLNDRSTIALKLLNVSFLPWFYMFMVGAYLSTRADLVEKIAGRPLLLYLLPYLATYAVAERFQLGVLNSLNPISFALLVGIIVKLAYTAPTLARRLLSGNDISYGVYIYHMPLVNLALYRQPEGGYAPFFLCLIATFIMATISWRLVEKPALSLKTVALRRYA